MTALPDDPPGPPGGPLPLVPYPLSARRSPGTLRLRRPGGVPRVRLGIDRGAEPEAALLRAALDACGIGTDGADGADGAPADAPEVLLRFGPTAHDGPEAYRLEIGAARVALTSGTREGLARGIQTLRQLLHAAPGLPHCLIDDAPRFPWRGVLLDVARHFPPKPFVLRMIDLAALHRLNTVHLHLTDDQGWRLPVPGRPRLTEVGGWREGTLTGHATRPLGFDATPHGGSWSRADLADIAAYAAARHITLVPEAGMPGHVQAALAAYPSLGVTGPHGVACGWGVSPHVLAPTEEALGFARDVLDAVLDAFDGPVIHLGGDECPRTEWRADPAVHARARALGLPSPDAVQSWFHARLAEHVRAAGRRVAGWDEMLEAGAGASAGPGAGAGDTPHDAPRDAIVMAWRDWIRPGVAGAALAAGHDVVQCPAGFTYLDHYQSDGPEEPLAQDGHLPLEKAAAFDPLAVGIPDGTLEAPGAGRVLGVQAQLWSEYLPTPEAVEYMAFPRLGALAEAGWSSAEQRAALPFAGRVAPYAALLDAFGVNHRPLDGPRPWQRGGTGRRARPAGPPPGDDTPPPTPDDVPVRGEP
ncbi:family 20 glycosylhydrolase [Streptomyces sp. NPDC048172]|uniref:family 20 glycosylhydrolase n=1 Tax=Streptomyces sp. NPDC048172 TaxID=3365505 RepID=UPI003723D441